LSGYLIRPAVDADLPRLRRWRAMPHVARWWGEPDVEPPEETLAEPGIACWIVEHDARPFAFIQDYAVHDWPPHHFDYLPAGSRGMDLYIGEPDLIGLGHGARFVRQHVDAMFGRGVPAVGIDPHPDNATAQAAFRKAGFSLRSGPIETRWGQAVLMDRHAAGDV
jgi:aminoglycoside 6'-N-acetyltransferase